MTNHDMDDISIANLRAVNLNRITEGVLYENRGNNFPIPGIDDESDTRYPQDYPTYACTQVEIESIVTAGIEYFRCAITEKNDSKLVIHDVVLPNPNGEGWALYSDPADKQEVTWCRRVRSLTDDDVRDAGNVTSITR